MGLRLLWSSRESRNAGIHLAQSCEIEGDVVSEHDSVDDLLEDGVALGLEDIETYVTA